PPSTARAFQAQAALRNRCDLNAGAAFDRFRIGGTRKVERMATMPRVLDLVGGTQGTPVEVTATLVTEFIIGLETFQFTEAVHTFEVSPDWLDRARLVAGPDVLTALARLGRIDWGLLLSAAIAERWLLGIGGFIVCVAAM